MDGMPKGELLIYQTEDGKTKIDVFFEDDTIWLNQKQISQLYQKGVNTINEHIKHIFDDGELDAEATIRKFRIVQIEGDREVSREVEYYNHGHTAAEIIAERADAAKNNMGLTNFEGSKVRKHDVIVAKNYLSQEELDELNRIVTMYLDHAEDMARQMIPMYMKDWAETLNDFLKFRKRDILTNAGKISKELAEKKALAQYEIYNQNRLEKAAKETDGAIGELEGWIDGEVKK